MTQDIKNFYVLKLDVLIIYIMFNIICLNLFILFMKLHFNQLIIIIKNSSIKFPSSYYL